MATRRVLHDDGFAVGNADGGQRYVHVYVLACMHSAAELQPLTPQTSSKIAVQRDVVTNLG
jgi:hypothetical protein